LSVKTARAVNSQLERLLPVITPLGLVLGFLLPGTFIHLRPLVPLLFGLMTLSGALRLRAAEFGKTIRSPLPILAFFVSSHVLMPLGALAVSSFFFGNSPDTVTGFVLLFAGPTAVSGFIWVSVFGGDRALCLTLILLDTMLAPLVVPGTVSILTGTKTAIDASGIAVSLVLMVVVPTIIGVTLNETSRGKIPDLICPYLDPVSKICLILVVAANTSPVSKLVRFDDLHVWAVAATCVSLSVTGYLLSRLAAATVKCNAEKNVTLLFSGGLRNIGAVTTVAVTFFPEAAALPALLGILFQQTLCAVMGKLLVKKEK
jgi:tagaturonate reductase